MGYFANRMILPEEWLENIIMYVLSAISVSFYDVLNMHSKVTSDIFRCFSVDEQLLEKILERFEMKTPFSYISG